MAKFPCYFQELQWKKRKLFPHNSKVSLFFSGTVKKKRKLCPHYRKVFWLFSGQLPPSTVMKKRKLFHIKCRLLSDPKKSFQLRYGDQKAILFIIIPFVFLNIPSISKIFSLRTFELYGWNWIIGIFNI